MSNNELRVSEVRYVDLKNPIERYKKRWQRSMKNGDTIKAKEIEEKDFGEIRQKGFDVFFDRRNLTVKVSKKKATS